MKLSQPFFLVAYRFVVCRRGLVVQQFKLQQLQQNRRCCSYCTTNYCCCATFICN